MKDDLLSATTKKLKMMTTKINKLYHNTIKMIILLPLKENHQQKRTS